MIIVWCS